MVREVRHPDVGGARKRSLVEVLRPDVDKLWDPTLRRIDTLLDDDDLVDRIADALARRSPQSRGRGRLGTPAAVVLRLLVLTMDGVGEGDVSDQPEQGRKVFGGRAPPLEGRTQGLRPGGRKEGPELALQLGPRPRAARRRRAEPGIAHRVFDLNRLRAALGRHRSPLNRSDDGQSVRARSLSP
jgi:hypothetical protein